MLDNLRLALSQNRKVLSVFFFIVFLPSLILAIFGIQSIQNEKFKLQQQILEEQKAYVRTLQTDIRSFLDNNASGLTALSFNRAFTAHNYPDIKKAIEERIQGGSLFGEIVIWDESGIPWFPAYQSQPLSARKPYIPDEWNKWQPDLNRAEISEFRRRKYPDAISSYRRILNRTKNEQVKAWILNRIARCQLKLEQYDRAQTSYRTIVSEYSGLFTESGRSLEFASRLEILNLLRSAADIQALLKEYIETCTQLEKKAWSLDESQLKLYMNSLENILTGGIIGDSQSNMPEYFLKSVSASRKNIQRILRIWRLAVSAEQSILPPVRDKGDASKSGSSSIEKRIISDDNEEVLLLLSPLPGKDSGQRFEFLGTLIEASILTENSENLLKKNHSDGYSVILRSNISDKIVFGGEAAEEKKLVFSDNFLENFPPWRVEIYQSEGEGSGFVLYKNIFFWMILSMMLILFFGSGLIIRLLVQEVNLLHLKSEFIASVSHEFKTPLTSMGAILEHLLDKDVTNPVKAREYYKILRHDSDRLKRLVANVLDFTKIEEGKRKYRMEPLDAGKVIRREVDSFEKEYRLSGFTVALDMKTGNFPVSADEEALSQALHNILDNAAKFSQREKRIEVSVESKEGKIEIAVQDHGIGIPETEQRKIFEKFYRGKQAASVSPTGTGLGLTLVKHIMTAHRGEVFIENMRGKGTKVFLCLPIREGGE